MNQLMKGEPMTIFGDGEQQRAFTHISDVAPIIAASVDVPSARNRIFNVGADVPYTVNDLARIVAGAMGRDYKLLHLDPRNEVKVAFSDHSLAESVFGSRPKVSLEEGIRSMTAWVREHAARTTTIFKDINIPTNFPPICSHLSP